MKNPSLQENDIPMLFSYGSIYEHLTTTCKVTNLQDSDDYSDEISADVTKSKPLTKGLVFL